MRIVKRYANRRLYDVMNTRYVTLAELRAWVVKGTDFSVIDAETGADIKQVLLA